MKLKLEEAVAILEFATGEEVHAVHAATFLDSERLAEAIWLEEGEPEFPTATSIHEDILQMVAVMRRKH